jgi:hypothetical protein
MFLTKNSPLAAKFQLAVGAIPFERIDLARLAEALDHDADAALGPLRRMPHVRGQEKNLALAHHDLAALARRRDQPQGDVAVHLVE